MGGVNEQHSLHPQYHYWGALKSIKHVNSFQGNKTPNCSPYYSGCVFTVCVFTAVCVHFGWVNFRAQIQSIGRHTWLYVTFTFSLHFLCTLRKTLCHVYKQAGLSGPSFAEWAAMWTRLYSVSQNSGSARFPRWKHNCLPCHIQFSPVNRFTFLPPLANDQKPSAAYIQSFANILPAVLPKLR